MDESTRLAIERGWMPKWAEYQLNGKSALENYLDQKKRIMDQFLGSKTYNVNIESVIKIK